MQRGFELLRDYPSVGDFLAYQYVTDLNYSELTRFTEMEFVVAGPGALDGIRKCFADSAGLNPPEIIRFMADRQEAEFKRLGLSFRPLWGRKLQLIDCQNLFCEVDKYARVAHPETVGISGRRRIKQRFRPNREQLAALGEVRRPSIADVFVAIMSSEHGARHGESVQWRTGSKEVTNAP